VCSRWPWSDVQPTLPPATNDAVHLLAVEAAVAIDQADLIRRLEGLASHDPLTGLMNRRAWNEHVDREVQRARRTGRPLSLAIIDLDHFKRYNDAHGHLAGDRLLKAAGAAWTSSLRGMDVLARWGGEEFAVLLPDTDTDDAITVLERLQRATPEGQTFSAGLAALDERGNGVTLTAAADEAVYAAKRAGRERISLAEGARSWGNGSSPHRDRRRAPAPRRHDR
jgi:diguanylate cyclase (GGDEF)-like protein